MKNKKIKFYGAPWCGDCLRPKNYLEEKGIGFEYINIDENNDAALEVEKINSGLRSIPTIVFPDGKVLVEPSINELSKAIESNKSIIVIHKNKMKGGDRND